MNADLKNMSTEEIIELYSASIKELKERKIIRTKNVIGELGEYLSIQYYNNTLGLPKLQAAPIGTQNIDAISINGERYSIKSTSTNLTGVFYGLEPKGSEEEDQQKFEYVIICRFDEDYQLKEILEIDWDTFIENKRWHSRMNAWNLNLSKKLYEGCKIIYSRKEEEAVNNLDNY
ncbi:hypothetical protein [Methanobrevibacter ruminantium]|uniref:hypothetical protein n=1 Tax=Methanobrevibacter ruminantium TaxID=83816 RepID=UPI002D80AA51|nr:hypothetical protein [Methanobrevibacter ruminantium]